MAELRRSDSGWTNWNIEQKKGEGSRRRFDTGSCRMAVGKQTRKVKVNKKEVTGIILVSFFHTLFILSDVKTLRFKLQSNLAEACWGQTLLQIVCVYNPYILGLFFHAFYCNIGVHTPSLHLPLSSVHRQHLQCIYSSTLLHIVINLYLKRN